MKLTLSLTGWCVLRVKLTLTLTGFVRLASEVDTYVDRSVPHCECSRCRTLKRHIPSCCWRCCRYSRSSAKGRLYTPACHVKHDTPRYTTIHHDTPRYTTIHHDTPRYTTIHHDTPRYTTIHHDTPRYTTIHHDTPRYTTIHHDTPRYTTIHHDTPRQVLARYTPCLVNVSRKDTTTRVRVTILRVLVDVLGVLVNVGIITLLQMRIDVGWCM